MRLKPLHLRKSPGKLKRRAKRRLAYQVEQALIREPRLFMGVDLAATADETVRAFVEIGKEARRAGLAFQQLGEALGYLNRPYY